MFVVYAAIMIMSVFTFQNVHRAWLECRRNKRFRPDAIRFEMNAEENIHCLATELAERSYHPSTSHCFAAIRPKLREIFAADFRDRVIHHLLVRHLEPLWEPVFIFDSHASRRKRGIHLAVKRLGGFLRKATGNGTRPAFYLQLDIKNFFMSMDRDILFDFVQNRCRDEEILWLARVLIYHDPTLDFSIGSPMRLLESIPRHKSLFGMAPNKGLPIGNLTSQFFANIYLNGLDQFIKHVLKCRYYMRYVDDLVLVADSREVCRGWREGIRGYLGGKLKLELRDEGKIRPAANGIDFLGYIARADYTLVRNRVVNNLKSRLAVFRKQLLEINDGIITVRYDNDVLMGAQAVLHS